MQVKNLGDVTNSGEAGKRTEPQGEKKLMNLANVSALVG